MTSIVKQSGVTVIHCILDPGSTDGSRELIRAQSQPGTICIFESDQGPVDGLNKGLRILRDKVDIIGYINSDDGLVPNALAEVLTFFAAHPEVDVLMGGIEILDQHNTVKRRMLPLPFDPARWLAGDYVFLQQGYFFRSRVLELGVCFNPENRTHWDLEFCVDLLLAGAVHQVHPVILGQFRIYPGTISAGIFNADAQWMERRRIDDERVRQKILAHGCKPKKGWWNRARFKLRPVHRLRERFLARYPTMTRVVR